MKKQTTFMILALIWMLSISFAQAQITSYPYTEDFEGLPAEFTWDNLEATTATCGPWEYGLTTATPTTGPNYGSYGPTFIFIDGDNCESTTILFAEGPEFDLSGLSLPTFSFDHFRYGSNVGDMDVEISTDGGSIWTSILLTPFTGSIQTAETDSWEKVSIDLSFFIDQSVLIRFAGEDRIGSVNGDIAIDNIQLIDAGLINGNGDVAYEYDAAGNRVKRMYTISSMAQSEQEQIAAARSVEDGRKVEFLDDELFKVFPNPATHFVQVESIEATGPTTLHLLDAAGRELQVAHMSGEASLQLDMSSYRSGVYVLWMQMEDRVVTKKIIKH